MDKDKESEVLKIVEALTTTGKKTLDEDKMKKLNKICGISDDYIKYAYSALMAELRKNHSEIRYSVLLIMNELFIRSSCFRYLLEEELDVFLDLVIGTETPLPKPLPRAKELKLKGLDLIQAWTSEYGERHVRLSVAINYLKSCIKIDFNDVEARSVVQREQRRKDQERQERVLNEKVKRVRAEMEEMKVDLSNTLVQMENCFRLLIPHPTGDFFSSQDCEKSEDVDHLSSDDCDIEDSKPSSSSQYDPSYENPLRQHGLYDMKKTITIEVKKDSEVAVQVNDDTLPIIESLNDFNKEVTNRFLPKVKNWLKILTKGSNCTDALKKAIDTKRRIESIQQKYRDLKIMPNAPNLDNDEEEDDFVEVKEKEGYEDEAYKDSMITRSASLPSCSKTPTFCEKAYMWKLKHSEEDAKDPTSAISTLSKRFAKSKTDMPLPKRTKLPPEQKDQEKCHKAQLLEKAPVLPYDIDLYHWEEEKPIIPEVVKFDSLHKFWDTKNDDDVNEALQEVQMASLRTRKIDFSGKFEPVKWSCRNRLPSGKLCPRKDRYKCPFHGKIVPRDSMGNPVNPQDVAGPSTANTAAVPEWQEPELLRDIEATTGLNLKIPKKGQRKRAQKKNGLTEIKETKTTSRERLAKKIFKRFKHYAKNMDEADKQRFDDKFGDQWNYY